LSGLGATYAVHIRLIGNPASFAKFYGATSKNLLKFGVSEGGGPEFQAEWDVPHQYESKSSPPQKKLLFFFNIIA